MKIYTYRIFNSISLVMLAARRVEKVRINCKIVPIPREFSSDCGVCLRTNFVDDRAVEKLLGKAGTKNTLVF